MYFCSPFHKFSPLLGEMSDWRSRMTEGYTRDLLAQKNYLSTQKKQTKCQNTQQTRQSLRIIGRHFAIMALRQKLHFGDF